jgi:hypothetical protein
MSSEFSRRTPLALNIVLAATVVALAVHKLNRSPAPLEVEPGEITNEFNHGIVTNEMAVFTEPPKLPRYADFASATDRRLWLVDPLRAMGVPNDMLALVARQDFEVQWDSRFRKCWGNRDKMARVQVEMDLSKDAEMRAALGEAGFKQWDQGNMLWEAMNTKVDVTPVEADALYGLKKKLQQRELELEQAKVNGTMDDAEIGDASGKAYSEYNQQMKALLGDDRYAKSQQLDDAFAAGNLQYSLAKDGVNPTDSQFQALFQAQQQWNKSLLELDPSSLDYAARYQALNAARDQAYQQVLGADVFNTLQEQQDPGYSQMKKYETLWGLDDSKIDYVYNTMKSYESSIQDYQAQINALQAQGQNADAVNQKLKQFTDQTGQALQNYLGQDSFNKLQRNRLFLFSQTQSPQ